MHGQSIIGIQIKEDKELQLTIDDNTCEIMRYQLLEIIEKNKFCSRFKIISDVEV